MSLSLIFLAVAVLYSAIGFGGGSSYIALLALYDYPYQSIPVLALVCNLVVVSGGVLHFYRKGYVKWQLCWPYLVGSMPMAFLGGRIPIEKEFFNLLLSGCLFLVALRLFFFDSRGQSCQVIQKPNTILAILFGAFLGLLSGLVGIGGGIFLSPILMVLKWATPKQGAATAALFILINSFFGLLGQMAKDTSLFHLATDWPLIVAVFAGGQLGSRLGSSSILTANHVRQLTALLVLFVSCRLFFF